MRTAVLLVTTPSSNRRRAPIGRGRSTAATRSPGENRLHPAFRRWYHPSWSRCCSKVHRARRNATGQTPTRGNRRDIAMRHRLICNAPELFNAGWRVRTVEYDDETDAYLVAVIDRSGAPLKIEYAGPAFRRRFPMGHFAYASGQGIRPMHAGEWWKISSLNGPSSSG